MKDFIEMNDNGDVSDSTLWEMLKVVIRVISFLTLLLPKKEKEKRLSEINNSLPALEKPYQDSKSPDEYKELAAETQV